MSDDSKIISLSDRARLRKGGRPTSPKAPQRGPGSRDKPADASGTDAQAPSAAAGPVPTRLVWLFCPTCESLEYTELVLPNGRVHQTCGTQVEEVVVDVDARAEYSLAELNLRQLERLAELVDGQRGRFREYQHRLELAAGQPLSSYPLTEDTVRVMPVAEVDPLGLLISAFLRQPVQRFRPEAGAEQTAPEPSAPGKPTAEQPTSKQPSSGPSPDSGDEPSR